MRHQQYDETKCFAWFLRITNYCLILCGSNNARNLMCWAHFVERKQCHGNLQLWLNGRSHFGCRVSVMLVAWLLSFILDWYCKSNNTRWRITICTPVRSQCMENSHCHSCCLKGDLTFFKLNYILLKGTKFLPITC